MRLQCPTPLLPVLALIWCGGGGVGFVEWGTTTRIDRLESWAEAVLRRAVFISENVTVVGDHGLQTGGLAASKYRQRCKRADGQHGPEEFTRRHFSARALNQPSNNWRALEARIMLIRETL
jgi:hypothetical protein